MFREEIRARSTMGPTISVTRKISERTRRTASKRGVRDVTWINSHHPLVRGPLAQEKPSDFTIL